MSKKYKVLDIFSGAGGMAEGFLQAGFEIPFASDISTQAKETYVNRHEQLGYSVTFYNDDLNNIIKNNKIVKGLKKEKFDVIIGGPPCQGFSNAGKRGKNDKRNLLIKSYLSLVAELSPKYFVMENVLGILSFKFDFFQGISGEVYKGIKANEILLNEFELLGYETNQVILDASDYGVPQRRKRVFFLGNKKRYKKIEEPEKVIIKYGVKDAIDDLVSNKVTSEYQRASINGRTKGINGKPINSKEILNFEKAKHRELTIKRFSKIKEGETLKEASKRFSNEEKKILATKKQNCKRLKASEPSATVLTLPDDLIHYSEDRILTVREMARLQSFDDSFKFLGKRTTGGKMRKKETPQYTLVGNAVPPLLAYAIAKKIKEVLDEQLYDFPSQ